MAVFTVLPGFTGLNTILHIGVSGFDQVSKCPGIDVTVGPEFHMAHELTGAFQQTVRIGNLGTTEEPDIDVSFKCIDVAECRIADTGGRMTGLDRTITLSPMKPR
jgi:hypothetical protein